MSIADEMSRISAALGEVENGKTAIAEAITAKGVDTLPGASFDTLATQIGLIEGGGGGRFDSLNMWFSADGESWIPITKTENWQPALENWKRMSFENESFVSINGAAVNGRTNKYMMRFDYAFGAGIAAWGQMGAFVSNYQPFTALGATVNEYGSVTSNFAKGFTNKLTYTFAEREVIRKCEADVNAAETTTQMIRYLAFYQPSDTGAAKVISLGFFEIPEIQMSAGTKYTYYVKFTW